MEIKLSIDTSGLESFNKIFNFSETISRERIDQLFDTPMYIQFVYDFGENIKELAQKDTWVDLFWEAYRLFESGSVNVTEEDPYKRNIIASVLWALEHREILPERTEWLIANINGRRYLEKSLQYLPTSNSDINIKVNLLMFMNNAFVQNGQIYVDVAFASQLTDEQFDDLLAHEMHHFLKDYSGCQYPRAKQGYEDLAFSLFALENEGIADMCSFEGLSFIYEWLGFTEKGFMKVVLGNVTKYLRDYFEMVKTKLDQKESPLQLHQYLMENQIVHPLGYSMASEIENTLGHGELLSCVGKPIEFARKYVEAVSKNTGEILLDDDTFSGLENIYQNN